MLRRASIALASCLFAAAPAIAQDVEAPVPDAETPAGDWTVALGGAWLPDYEGSNDYRVIPGGFVRGKIGGITFTTRGLYLFVDVLSGSGPVEFDAGPIVGLRLNRTGKVKDDVVDELPELNSAIEVGAFAGVTLKELTNPYDRLSFRLDAVKDLANAHESTVISPNIDYSTPLSRTLFVSASLSADFVSNKFADYYFSVTPAESLATGLPVYEADGGMKSWQLGLLVNQSLSGGLRRGLSLFGLGSYKRLVGDFRRSPIVSDRGTPNQWFAAAGLAYTF